MRAWHCPGAVVSDAPPLCCCCVDGHSLRAISSGDVIGVKVAKLDSVKTQLPYDYYSLPFCRPPTIEESAENLGEVLSGDRIENSTYKVEQHEIALAMQTLARVHAWC